MKLNLAPFLIYLLFNKINLTSPSFKSFYTEALLSKISTNDSTPFVIDALQLANLLNKFQVGRISEQSFKRFLQFLTSQNYAISNPLEDAFLTLIKLKNVATFFHQTWIYAICAALIISVAGIVCVSIFPHLYFINQNVLLQYLIALAIGTLSGDALLHLLPHALSPVLLNARVAHNFLMYKASICLLSILVFFILERSIELVREIRKNKNIKKALKEKLYSSKSNKRFSLSSLKSEKRLMNNKDYNIDTLERLPINGRISKDEEKEKEIELIDNNSSCTNEKRENSLNNSYHTHDHNHHHFKRGIENVSIGALVWMVILGDGIHNFCDGIAIGAAFSGDIVSGITTSIAIFCHELPHETGDFAVLLKSGLAFRRALGFNIFSSILCFLGTVLGLLLGNINEISSWLFCAVAGMFIYVSLVDMLPQLQSPRKSKGNYCYLLFFLHVLGLFSGMCLMFLIGLYEDRIKELL